MPNALRPRLLAIAAASLLSCSAYAANDCGVTVKFLKAVSNGAGVELSFQVTNTSCPGSAGRFVYAYEDAAKPGVFVDRNSPSWRPVDGKSFTWTDVIPGKDLKVLKVRVPPDGVESKKG